jgi:hypothetical protein
VEGTSQAVLGSSDQRKIPASLSLFLKSEKIRALLYLGKGPEYRPFRDFRPVTSAYRPWGQISNHGRACTQDLLLYKKFLTKVGNFSFLEMAAPIQTTTLNLGVDQKEKKKTNSKHSSSRNRINLQ